MRQKKTKESPPAEPAAPKEPAEEVPEFVPEPRIPVGEEAAAETPKPRSQEAEERVHTTESNNEILVRYAEERDLPDQELPDIMALLGQEQPEKEQRNTEPRMYQTTIQNSTMGDNLVIHPAIAAGRCELCGSTRFVNRRNGTRGEVWKIVNRKTGESHHSYRRGEWLEIHAANCPHYRHVDIRCSYCNEGFTGTKDRKGAFTETLSSRILYVFSERGRPRDLIMVCSDFNCKMKFDNQYHINQTL